MTRAPHFAQSSPTSVNDGDFVPNCSPLPPGDVPPLAREEARRGGEEEGRRARGGDEGRRAGVEVGRSGGGEEGKRGGGGSGGREEPRRGGGRGKSLISDGKC